MAYADVVETYFFVVTKENYQKVQTAIEQFKG